MVATESPWLSSQPQNTEERSPEELHLQLWTHHGRFTLQKYLCFLPHLLTQWTDTSLYLGPLPAMAPQPHGSSTGGLYCHAQD